MGKARADYKQLKKKKEQQERRKQEKEKNASHFALKNKEAIAKNKQGLFDYLEQSKSALQNVLHHTQVVKSPIRNEDLEEVLKHLGIESVAYYQVRYTGDGSNDDEDDLKWRGGFSAKEANKQVSHAPVSIKTTTNSLSKEFVRD
jgi:hypothetical protein